MEMCLEWRDRGFKDNQLKVFAHVYGQLDYTPFKWEFSEELYASHRAALLAKNPEYYEKFGWTEKPQIKYIWR